MRAGKHICRMTPFDGRGPLTLEQRKAKEEKASSDDDPAGEERTIRELVLLDAREKEITQKGGLIKKSLDKGSGSKQRAEYTSDPLVTKV